MSRRIVGYEGEGKRRRPIYSDPIEADLSGNPPGPVTTRQAADHERGGFASRIQGTGLIRLPRRSPLITPPPAIAELITTVTAEEPVMPEPIAAPEPEAASPGAEPLVATLAVHVDAARAAQEAWEAFDAADTARIHAEEAWLAARAALEASWLALWHQGDWMAPAELGPDDPDPAPATSPESSTDIPETIPVAAPRVRAATAPDPTALPSAAFAAFSAERAAAAPEAGGGPGAHALPGNGRVKQASGLTRRQEQVLEVVRRHRGDRAKAAAELRVRYQSVNTVLEAIGRAGRLPAELIAQLPASFARYQGV